MTYLPITLSGNLIEDPVSKSFDTGTFLTRLRLASSRRVPTETTDANGVRQWADTDILYIDVECWGQLAVNTNASLRKGMPVIVSGRLVSEKWTDKEGTTRYKHIIKANQVAIGLSRHQVASRSTASQEHTPKDMDPVQLKSTEDFVEQVGVTATQSAQSAQSAQSEQSDQSSDQQQPSDGTLTHRASHKPRDPEPAMAG